MLLLDFLEYIEYSSIFMSQNFISVSLKILNDVLVIVWFGGAIYTALFFLIL
jgi:hypothetical protein